MRISPALAAAVLASLGCLTGCSSLPFGSRPKKNDGDAAAGELEGDAVASDLEAEKTAVRGAASKVSQSERDDFADASAVVEAFFAEGGSSLDGSADDEGSLGETLRKMAGAPQMHDFLEKTRRALHRNPELMYELPFTSDTIKTLLEELAIPYTSGWAKNTHQEVFPGPGGYGVVAHVGTMNPEQPTVILRADMDALPIKEATTDIEEFKSHNDGKMHACGHDGHVTMLLGAAALLKSVESQIAGTVRLVFQPAEEGGAGMKRMVEEGVVEAVEGLKAELAFGMHVWPTLPSGSVATRPGPLMAAAEMFTITLHGKGGHAAMPHLTIDPIVAASSLVVSLQSIVSRTISPLDSGVVSVTQITAGDAFNVIPASATLKGTIRALSTEMLVTLRDRVENMMKSVSSLHGVEGTIDYMPDFYPPTVCDPKISEWSASVGALVSREGVTRETEHTMGGEDFAFLTQAVPSTFFFVGQGGSGDESHHLPRTDYGLHHPSFALDEGVLPIGVELHSNLALRSLRKLTEERESEESTKVEL